jgi:sugar phosphate isomerase/epimerase
VYHPLEYPLTGEKGPHSIDVMRRLAAVSDLGIIIHDEGEKGKRLTGAEAEQYERGVKIISGLCPVSIENSYDSGDITWFWERFVVPMPETVSITLDIGHLELADIVSTEFVRHLPDHLVRRIQFVHMHHHDRNGHGVKDHRPLVPDCREIEALKILIERKKDLWVIVELDAAEEGMGRSIELLERMQNAQ